MCFNHPRYKEFRKAAIKSIKCAPESFSLWGVLEISAAAVDFDMESEGVCGISMMNQMKLNIDEIIRVERGMSRAAFCRWSDISQFKMCRYLDPTHNITCGNLQELEKMGGISIGSVFPLEI